MIFIVVFIWTEIYIGPHGSCDLDYHCSCHITGAIDNISVIASFTIMKPRIYKRELYINSHDCSHPKI